MAERIHGLDTNEAYKVAPADEGGKRQSHDQNPEDNEENQRRKKEKEKLSEDTFAGFDEKTNWNHFLDQSRLWKKLIEIPKEKIEKIYFGKLNIKTDPSLLRVNIRLKDGSFIKPGFISMSREMAIKCQHLKPGTPMSFETISMENILRVSLPNDARQFQSRLQNITNEQKKSKKKQGFLNNFLSFISLIDPKSGGFRPEGLLINIILISMIVLVITAIILVLE